MNQRKKKRFLIKKITIAVLISIGIVLLGSGAYVYKVYHDVRKATDKMYKEIPVERTKELPSIIEKEAPFSVLLLGIDTGDQGRMDQGRSDSVMVMTVNPQKKKTTVVSIPRDTYIDIDGYGTDKINHAYAFGGVELSINTIHKFLDIPIDYYVEINMRGIKELVDALGGIEINNQLDFTYEGTTFPLGNQHLDGERALKYIRMRYEDPTGDYGRQERHRKVVEAMLRKIASFSTIANYQNILNILADNVKTNFTFDELYTIQLKHDYRISITHVEQEQMKGVGEMIDGISYQIVDTTELARISEILKRELKDP